MSGRYQIIESPRLSNGEYIVRDTSNHKEYFCKKQNDIYYVIMEMAESVVMFRKFVTYAKPDKIIDEDIKLDFLQSGFIGNVHRPDRFAVQRCKKEVDHV